ncbi:MAG TPA: cytidine deaminase [Alloacidobacterium sp.]|nr:cytidine deaminase [Alloacidobacterium sp.]
MATLTQEIVEQLHASALDAAQHAYAPYSGFRVGCSLLFDDGQIVSGCNVENVSYSLTICAERSALVRAIAESGANRKIAAVMVTNLNQAASNPCGACLQMLSEFTTPETRVYFSNGSEIVQKPFTDLLPCAFSIWTKETNARG